MAKENLKVVVLTHGNVSFLLEKLLEVAGVEVAGVFVETNTQVQRGFGEKIKRSLKYDGYFETVKKFSIKVLGGTTEAGSDVDSIKQNQRKMKEFAAKKGFVHHQVESFHSEESKKLLRQTNSDLGILYGTNIIKKDVFSIPRLGSINIHQGLTPYYRGGPSVFWELFNGETEVGVTVHFVAAKVDTGDVIIQKTFPLKYNFEKYSFDYERFLEDFRSELNVPMNEMIVEAVSQIAVGTEQRSKQDLSIGKRYRLPIKAEKDAMLKVLQKRKLAGKIN